MQGPVSNYGAGLVIILTRMYKVGDTITVVGHSGVVTEITLALTRLIAEDGENIVIPNKQIAGEVHINSHANRVVEGSVGVAYDDDPVQAIEVIRAVRGAYDSLPTAGRTREAGQRARLNSSPGQRGRLGQFVAPPRISRPGLAPVC